MVISAIFVVIYALLVVNSALLVVISAISIAVCCTFHTNFYTFHVVVALFVLGKRALPNSSTTLDITTARELQYGDADE